MAKYIEKELGRYVEISEHVKFICRKEHMLIWLCLSYSYPKEPVVPHSRKPPEAPTYGKDDAIVDTNESLDLIATDNHYIPGCEDHPIQSSSTFGATTVNDDAMTECADTNALSGVMYNVFYGLEKTPNIYDNFCQNIDGNVNFKSVFDAHGNQRDPGPSRRELKRTPPPDPDSYDTFNFELGWEKNDTAQGCGQTVESCREAGQLPLRASGWPAKHTHRRRQDHTPRLRHLLLPHLRAGHAQGLWKRLIVRENE